MPTTDPAPDLAAVRARLDEAAQRSYGGECWIGTTDFLALLAAYDAQAARLAAVEQAVADNQWIRSSHPVEYPEVGGGRCPTCSYTRHPCDTISLLEDVEAALKGDDDGR